MKAIMKTPDGVVRNLDIVRDDDKIGINLSQLLLGFMPYNYDLNFKIILEMYDFYLITNDIKSRLFLIKINDLTNLDNALINKTIKKYKLSHLKLEEISYKVK